MLITITPIRNNTYQNKKQTKYTQFKTIQDTVSFGQKDLLSQSPEEITTQVKNSLTLKNFIAAGGDAEVYKIENSDYCIRIPFINGSSNNKKPISKVKQILENQKPFSITTEISPSDKVNHVKAKLNNKYSIMKYINGMPVATPFMSEDEIIRNAKTIEEAPIESFSKLLHQVCEAYKYNMYFDCTSVNVIVNPKDKTFTAIDFYKAEFPESLHPLSHIFAALSTTKTTTEQQKIFAGKIFKATLEELKPNVTPCTSITNFDFYRFIYKLANGGIIENQNYVNLLCQMFADIEELKMKEARRIDVTRVLNGKIKVVNTLVKQLFNVV
ncbi:MAG: hypothetical protein ACI37Q_03630 [Candidatus Gastranaerophilaceae bacterium]